MKKSMRILVIAISVVLILGSIAACSNSNNTSGNDTSNKETSGSTTVKDTSGNKEATSAKPVTIRFGWWGSDARHESTLAAIEAYQKKYPNVTIEGEFSGWDGYLSKLSTQLAGGTAPELIQLSYSWISDWQKKGRFFVDLSKYPQLMDLGMFSEATINDSYCKVDNEIVGIPAGSSAAAFLVNKDLLTKANVPLNQKWTWDSYLDAAKKVHSLGDDYYFSAFEGVDKEVLYLSYLRPFVISRTGNAWINDDYTMGFTKDNLVEAFNYIKALNDNNAWPSVTEVSSGVNMAADPRWINGKIGSTIGWVSGIAPAAKAIGDAADVEVFPSLADGKDTGMIIIPSMIFSVNAKNENIEETIKFLNYMFTDEEAIKILNTSRGVPPSKKGMEVAAANNLVAPIVMKSLNLALDKPSSVPFSAISDDTILASSAKDTISKLLFSKLTPEAAADEVISAYTARLADMKAGK